jgi:hypothetical protein
MILFRHIAACAFVLTGAYPIAGNFFCIVVNVRKAVRKVPGHVSMVPIAGPILASVGVGLWRGTFDLWLAVPWLVDPGSWMVLAGITYAFRRWRSD